MKRESQENDIIDKKLCFKYNHKNRIRTNGRDHTGQRTGTPSIGSYFQI